MDGFWRIPAAVRGLGVSVVIAFIRVVYTDFKLFGG